MFKKTSVYDLSFNVFEEINKNWMLITAKNPDGKVNTMTASWGMMGEIWGKEAVTVYIRQSRYTKEFVDSQEYFTLSLFDGYKKELGILGSKSGRDGDKISEVGFTIEEVDNQPTFSQCKAVLVCKKMYQNDIAIKDMKEDIVKAMYQDGDQHTMYIAEIVGCYVNA
ncbi:MAG: flavin reductase [Lachnospiraceae bacterium]|nr:flavin reductase [Lachnospiraceae bacterium]